MLKFGGHTAKFLKTSVKKEIDGGGIFKISDKPYITIIRKY